MWCLLSNQCLMIWSTGARRNQLKAPKVPEIDLSDRKLAAALTSLSTPQRSELSGDCWDSLRQRPMTLIRDNRWFTEKWTAR